MSVSKNQIKLVKSLDFKKNRRKEGLFVAEGPKVVGDLLRAGFTSHFIFATESYIIHQPSFLSPRIGFGRCAGSW